MYGVVYLLICMLSTHTSVHVYILCMCVYYYMYIYALYRIHVHVYVYIPYFLEKSLRLLFISALPQCGDYSRAAIRGRLLFEVQTSRLLFISDLPQCGDYSRAATMSKYRRRGYYLFQCYCNAATIRGRLLFEVWCLFEEIRCIYICLVFKCIHVYCTYILFGYIVPWSVFIICIISHILGCR